MLLYSAKIFSSYNFSNIIYEIFYTLHLEHANSPFTYGVIGLSVLCLMQHNPWKYKYAMYWCFVMLHEQIESKIVLQSILCPLWSPLCSRIYEGSGKILCSRLVVISMFQTHILCFLLSPLS